MSQRLKKLNFYISLLITQNVGRIKQNEKDKIETSVQFSSTAA